MSHVTGHARGFAEYDFEIDIYRMVMKMTVAHLQMSGLGRFAQDCKRTALTLAHRLKFVETPGWDRQHITFLGFIAPDFSWRHAGLFGRHGAQLETPAPAAAVYQFRQRIGQPARADIVYRQNWIVRTHLPAAVNNFLGTTLHFRIAALHRIKIQVSGVGAGGHT